MQKLVCFIATFFFLQTDFANKALIARKNVANRGVGEGVRFPHTRPTCSWGNIDQKVALALSANFKGAKKMLDAGRADLSKT